MHVLVNGFLWRCKYLQAIRFLKGTNVAVLGITLKNSPQVNLKFNWCTGGLIKGVTILCPGNSPNTDGIHLQTSVYNFVIEDCVIESGKHYNKWNILLAACFIFFIKISKLINTTCHVVIKVDPWHFDVDFRLFCSALRSCFVSFSTDWHLYCDNSAGDDCISIQQGTYNLVVKNIKCGPGHGIRYVQKSCPTSLIIQSWFDVTDLLCILHICICSR